MGLRSQLSTSPSISKHIPFLVGIICLIPTVSGFITANATPLMQPSRLQTLQRTLMMQQQQQCNTAGSSTDTTTTSNDDSSSPPIFSPSSKYHPDQNGLAQRRRWLVVDFDGTCTEQDTTPLLPKLAALATRQQRRSSIISASDGSNESANNDSESLNEKEANNIHKQDLQRRLDQFQTLENEFMRLFGEAKSTLLSTDDEQSSGEEEQSIHDILDALDEPSTIVTQMVSESRVLRGLGHADARELEGMLQLHGVTVAADNLDSSEKEVESVGEHKVEGDDFGEDKDGVNTKKAEDKELFDKVVVRLRHGCESTLARILSDNDQNITNRKEEEPPSCLGWSLAVLSINWCPALINASLVRPVLKKRRRILQLDSCEREIPIWSNHVDGEGVVSLHIPGALAKRDRIMELRSHILQTSSYDSQRSVIVYVGDSSTDLAALLEADIGIIMGTSSSTSAIAKRWGIQIVPLEHRRDHGFGSGSSSSLDDDVGVWRKKKMLWQVESWQEIDEMLIELDEYWS